MGFEERLEAFYENEGREDLRLQKGGEHYLEYLTATKYIDRYLPAQSRVLDSCAGSGTYAFYLAGKGHIVTAGDVLPGNIALIEANRKGSPALEKVYLGDACKLSGFENGSFDAVLCMGALYHLPNAADRKRAVSESMRVLRDGGLCVFTYMNRYAVILGNSKGNLDNIDEILAFAKEGVENVFYASTPEEMEQTALEAGVKKLCHLTLDGMSNFMHMTAGLLNKKGLERWRKYHFATCEKQSLLGCGYHNMFIGMKPENSSLGEP